MCVRSWAKVGRTSVSRNNGCGSESASVSTGQRSKPETGQGSDRRSIPGIRVRVGVLGFKWESKSKSEPRSILGAQEQRIQGGHGS